MTMARWLKALLWLALISLFPVCLVAQGRDWVQKNYIKTEAMIPMRDGVRLFTSIYTPRQGSFFPILLRRTPYGVEPYGRNAYADYLGPSERFSAEGFIFVSQDVRGRSMSEGIFLDMTPHRAVKKGPADVDESTDTYDTIEWLLAHVPGNNGRVGQWGISYPGFYAAAGMIDAHPALVASSPQAPIMDWFAGDDFHRNGALWLPHLFNFIAWFGPPRPKPTTKRPSAFRYGTSDGYAFFLETGPLSNVNSRYFKGRIPFWNEVMAHGTYDAFWKMRDLRPHLRDIKPAVLVVGGWFDAENLYGALQAFQAIEAQSPATQAFLVMGPWYHGAWENDSGEMLGTAVFGSRTSDFFLDEVEFPFFMHYLKGTPDPELPKAMVFETGVNQWLRMDSWPPKARRDRMYFHPGGGLGFAVPVAGEGADEFLSDPAKPVPSFDGLHTDMPKEYMTADQRFVSSRPDVLTYRTASLNQDLVVAGPIRVHLAVSTTGTDADWVVKVIDEYPEDGESTLPGCLQLVRGEIMRGKFRNSLEQPKPFVPGEPTTVEWTLNDICHAFRKGHRLTVQVQSSWFPLMDRNPQVFTDIYSAKAGDFKAARHRVYYSAALPSYLELPVLEPEQGSGHPLIEGW
jgi:uncharacterized protein